MRADKRFKPIWKGLAGFGSSKCLRLDGDDVDAQLIPSKQSLNCLPVMTSLPYLEVHLGPIAYKETWFLCCFLQLGACNILFHYRSCNLPWSKKHPATWLLPIMKTRPLYFGIRTHSRWHIESQDHITFQNLFFLCHYSKETGQAHTRHGIHKTASEVAIWSSCMIGTMKKLNLHIQHVYTEYIALAVY